MRHPLYRHLYFSSQVLPFWKTWKSFSFTGFRSLVHSGYLHDVLYFSSFVQLFCEIQTWILRRSVVKSFKDPLLQCQKLCSRPIVEVYTAITGTSSFISKGFSQNRSLGRVLRLFSRHIKYQLIVESVDILGSAAFYKLKPTFFCWIVKSISKYRNYFWFALVSALPKYLTEKTPSFSSLLLAPEETNNHSSNWLMCF